MPNLVQNKVAGTSFFLRGLGHYCASRDKEARKLKTNKQNKYMAARGFSLARLLLSCFKPNSSTSETVLATNTT